MTQPCEHPLWNLLNYCRAAHWAGYDPYDGLNSWLAHIPIFQNKPSRTLLIQLVKRSPVNLRTILGVNKGFNAKGVALCARAIQKLAVASGFDPESLQP